MKHGRTVNMTVGNPYSLLIVFAIPMLIGNLFQQAYNLADSIIVGRFLGADSLAAVGATGSVSFLFFSVCNGISSGGGVVTAQFFGAGDVQNVKKSIVSSAYIMFSLSLVTAIISFFAAPALLVLLRTPDSVREEAVIYMRMTCAGVPLVAVYNYSSSMLRALGDSGTPLIFLIIACVLNILLDLLFVRVFGMGVFGAALATMLAQMLAGFGCLFFALKTNEYFVLKREHLVPDRVIIRKACRIGFPLAMQWSLIAVSTTVLQSFVNGYGSVAMAAYTATCRLEQIVQQPFGSLSAALSTYAGQNYGAGEKRRLKAGLRANIFLTLASALLMTVIARLFNGSLVGIFVDDPKVVSLGGSVLLITSIFYWALGMIYAARGILNGIGDALFAFINGIIEILCRILLPYVLLALIPGIDVRAIWWSSGLTWFISGAFCMGRYFFWRKKNMPSRGSVGRLNGAA